MLKVSAPSPIAQPSAKALGKRKMTEAQLRVFHSKQPRAVEYDSDNEPLPPLAGAAPLPVPLALLGYAQLPAQLPAATPTSTTVWFRGADISQDHDKWLEDIARALGARRDTDDDAVTDIFSDDPLDSDHWVESDAQGAPKRAQTP